MRRYRAEFEPTLEEPSVFLWLLLAGMVVLMVFTIVAGTWQFLAGAR